jgi:8-oxo-dGTP pyrophosphatase MutT (NUDIX family)
VQAGGRAGILWRVEGDEPITIERVEQALAKRNGAGLLGLIPGLRRAAVAVVLRPDQRDACALLIRRTEREDDPWSGQMALPGGRVEPRDGGCVREAARRETHEEVGVDLTRHGRWLGRLPDQQAIGRGRPLPMIISPQVYALQSEPELALDGREVAEALWVPLGALASGHYDGTHSWRAPGLPARLDLPCWRYRGRTIWGLTHRMLGSLLEIL